MAQTKFLGQPVQLAGELPAVGTQAPDFTLTGKDLKDVSLEDFKGKRVVLNIFPSVDTDVCATSVRKFNAEANELPNTVVLCISADLPFASARFCAANGLDNVVTLSGFRSDFGKKYGVEILDGPMRGLYARSLVVIDETGKVIGTQVVDDITHEPDYDLARKLLK